MPRHSSSSEVRPVSHVALLRGINVGGKNLLAMSTLVALFEQAGCQTVQTYIQSGNVLFAADPALAGRIANVVHEALSSARHLAIPVVIRSVHELRAVTQSNPFLRRGADPKSLHVMFLADAPTAARSKALDHGRSPPDEFEVRGREIYLCCPNGLARSKLTNSYFDSALGTVSTARNWNTVNKLVELSGS